MTNGTNSFLLAPAVTGKDHSGKVSQAPDHLLPYGIILEEYAVRRSRNSAGMPFLCSTCRGATRKPRFGSHCARESSR